MDIRVLLAEISREFLKNHKVFRYRMKKVSEMSDDDVITYCHWFYEENNLLDEWLSFRKAKESEHLYCSYLEEFIDQGLCYDIQMISNNLIKNSALPEININKKKALLICNECKHCL